MAKTMVKICIVIFMVLLVVLVSDSLFHWAGPKGALYYLGFGCGYLFASIAKHF
jgi:hypothetical protein